MRKLLTIASLVAMSLAPTALNAQVGVGGQLSFANDVDIGIGARATFGLPAPAPLEIVATADYFFPDEFTGVDLSYWEINANLVYLFKIPASIIQPYAGGGLNFAHASFSTDFSELGVEVPPEISNFEGSDSQLGLNLLGGAKLNLGPITPFGELRYEVSGGEQFVVSMGALFQVGPGIP